MEVYRACVVFLSLFCVCSGAPGPCSDKDEFAVCSMVANPNKPSEINGTIHLYQRVNPDCTYDFLSIQVNIDNVPFYDGTDKHGFHVHEFGDMSGGCESMGGHYNPRKAPHGYGWSAPSARHIGDLGNVRQKPNSGKVETRLVDYLASLVGQESIMGRGIVLHASEDDLGMKKDVGSKKTGNAGPRLACCVIGRSPPISLDKFSLYRK